MMYLLSLITWLPIIIGILILFLAKNENIVKITAIMTSLIVNILSIILFIKFNDNISSLQFVENFIWISNFNINYAMGVDGISMPFILLNNFITLLVLIISLKTIKQKVAFYNSMFLIMTGFITGAFCANDAILFYVFFEAMLIPMYLIIGIWGGSNRVYAAIKFFLYTLLGSLLMLVALLYLYSVSGKTFDIFMYYRVPLTMTAQILIFIAFFLSFAVKVPMWPLHTWLPDAHPEAPTGGSMVLAAITLKIGGYGFLRFALPIVPDAVRFFSPYMVVLSLIAIVYIGLVAIVQKDMKKLVAYSSISHMGFVTLGTFMLTNQGFNVWAMEGAIIQMISHGFVSAAMFMCIGVMYDRIHSRNIIDYGGIAIKMPIFAAFFLLFSMANSGLPGTSGFVGEFMVIMGAVQINFIYALLASLTLILGAGYTLWMYKRTIFGVIVNSHINDIKDVDLPEFIVLILLACGVLVMGIYPELFVSKIHSSVNLLLEHSLYNKVKF
jgi:NADH-quinone oxidoreductase subunit M